MTEQIEKSIENAVKDEELENADWEYFYDETTDSPYAEATAVIDGKNVTVGYLWNLDEGGCYARIDDKDVEDEHICEHYCEVAEKKIGKKLTGLSYELYERWVEYHLHEGLVEFDDLYEGWEDMDEDERYARYLNARVAF